MVKSGVYCHMKSKTLTEVDIQNAVDAHCANLFNKMSPQHIKYFNDFNSSAHNVSVHRPPPHNSLSPSILTNSFYHTNHPNHTQQH